MAQETCSDGSIGLTDQHPQSRIRPMYETNTRGSKEVAAQSAPLYRLITRGPSRIAFSDGMAYLERSPGQPPEQIPAISIIDISIRTSWFKSRLELRLHDGTRRTIGGLGRQAAAQFRDSVIQDQTRYAPGLSLELVRLDETVSRILGGKQFSRRSESEKVHEALRDLTQRASSLLRRYLEREGQLALDRLVKLNAVQDFETARERANDIFVTRELQSVLVEATSVLPFPLTEEQAVAIATDEDVTMVLAGAGTGKTAVIVGKIAHLVNNLQVPPEEVLVLAFNREAAEEIRERLPGKLSKAHVHTFHAFARQIVANSGTAPTISTLATDKFAMGKAMDSLIRKLLEDPEQSQAVTEFILYHTASYVSPFDFENNAAYHDYVKNVELRILSGGLVKSFEELTIANFLTQNGIEFDYERDYSWRTATEERHQYQPDFFLPTYEIWIEHFALNEKDQAPPRWTGYKEGVIWKRGIHAENNTTLIETYSWQMQQGTLLSRLREQLEEAGVAFDPVSREELVKSLSREQVSSLARLTATFLNHVKTNGLSVQDLEERSDITSDQRRKKVFLDVFEQVQHRYQALLADEMALDFHDLINQAAEAARTGQWVSQYKYVLVDEFQDISRGRMALLQALRGQSTAYFLAGDDWQSIYRFAGSDVSLVRNCSQYLGYTRERPLTQTFRFGEGILTPSTAFIRRNPEQTQRTLETAKQDTGPGMTVIAETNTQTGVDRALREIKAQARDSEPLVLVLGRYRHSRSNLPWYFKDAPQRVRFSTVHAGKGKEADYTVLVDLRDGRMGFPSRTEDDPILDMAMPHSRDGRYPFSEERRLFYVALTRAKRGVYLVTDPARPSPFVRELLEGTEELEQIGALTPECPRCSGRMVPSQSQLTLRCSNFPYCTHLAHRCPNCRAGHAVVSKTKLRSECTNPACKAPPGICPSCRTGVLVRRRSQFGQLWGCTEYGSQFSCTYTETIDPR